MGSMTQHSRLVQRRINSVSSCERHFEPDPGSNEIPVVLIPSYPALFHLALNVPSGPYILWQKWHKHQGPLTPGVRWFWPAFNRISHVVNKKLIVYNAPARDCPTADNVMVNVDVSVNFSIGPDAEAAQKFVYRLGANRFDELLAAKCEEAIRGLVYSVTHDKVNDLREDFASEMVGQLAAGMSEYGVDIRNVKITDVKLPRELSQTLERTTAFKTRMGEQEKTHENSVRVLLDKEAQELEMIKKANARKLQELHAECNRYEIIMKEMEETAKGELKVSEMNAQSKADVMITHARGEKDVASVNGQRQAEALLKRTEIECEERKIRSDQDYNTKILASQAKLTSAESHAQAMVASAEAEAKGAKNLEEKRRFELEWERLRILSKIAGKGRKFISGARGEQILNDLTPQVAQAKR